MKDSDRYLKVVAWSQDDDCYVGTAPGLMYGGCHGDDERAVFDELVSIVDDWINHFKTRGEPLPPATAQRLQDFISSP